MSFSFASPEAIATGVAMAMSVTMVARKLWESKSVGGHPVAVSVGGGTGVGTPPNGTGGGAAVGTMVTPGSNGSLPLMPQGVAGGAVAIPGVAPVVTGPPLALAAQAAGDGGGAISYGPLPLPVTYLNALMVLSNLFANVYSVVLVNIGLGHLVMGTQKKIRSPDVRPGMGFFRAVGWEAAAIAFVNMMREAAARMGNACRAKPGFDAGRAAADALARLQEKIFQYLPAGSNDRYQNRNDLVVTYFRCAGVIVRRIAVPRTTSQSPYPVFEFGPFRSDVGWTMMYFICIRCLAMGRGASKVQAEFIASAAVIELVGVSVGLNGKEDWGVSPSDLGIPTPAMLPQRW